MGMLVRNIRVQVRNGLRVLPIDSLPGGIHMQKMRYGMRLNAEPLRSQSLKNVPCPGVERGAVTYDARNHIPSDRQPAVFL